MFYYLRGYQHQFLPDGASSTASVERGLPVQTYATQFPKHLGRARPGEIPPTEGAAAVQSAEKLARGRHV